MEPTEAVRYAISLAMLGGAAILDLRTRRVPNAYWVPFAALAGVLWLGDAATGLPAATLGLQAALAAGACALLYLLWRLGGFGGADAKGLMVLAWLWPTAPDLLAGSTVAAVDVLVNACVLVAALPVLLLVANTVHGRLRLPAALLGVPLDVHRAERAHVWPMQQVDAAGRLRWRYLHRPGTDLEAAYADLHRAGVGTVWVTPKIPFMVPLALALLMWPVWGNLALHLAALLAG